MHTPTHSNPSLSESAPSDVPLGPASEPSAQLLVQPIPDQQNQGTPLGQISHCFGLDGAREEEEEGGGEEEEEEEEEKGGGGGGGGRRRRRRGREEEEEGGEGSRKNRDNSSSMVGSH